jgi:hypothetical protein
MNELSTYILDKFGKKHTDCIVITFTGKYHDTYGLYTWKGNVCVINQGWDNDLSSVDLDIQKKILTKIKDGDYKISPDFQ